MWLTVPSWLPADLLAAAGRRGRAGDGAGAVMAAFCQGGPLDEMPPGAVLAAFLAKVADPAAGTEAVQASAPDGPAGSGTGARPGETAGAGPGAGRDSAAGPGSGQAAHGGPGILDAEQAAAPGHPGTGRGDTRPAAVSPDDPEDPAMPGAGGAAGPGTGGAAGPGTGGGGAPALGVALGRCGDNALLGLIRGWRRIASLAAAGELAAVAELADRRAGQAKRAGEWDSTAIDAAQDEIAAALTLTPRATALLTDRATALQQLPATAAALAAGLIDWPKALVLLTGLAGQDPALARLIEAQLIGRAPALTTGQLRAALNRALLAAGPAAAERRRQHEEQHARIEKGPEYGGVTACLTGRNLPVTATLAAWNHLSGLARQLRRTGTPGTLDELRVRVYLALLTGQPPTTSTPGTPSTGTGTATATGEATSGTRTGHATGNTGPADTSAGPAGPSSARSGAPGTPPGPAGTPTTGPSGPAAAPRAGTAGPPAGHTGPAGLDDDEQMTGPADPREDTATPDTPTAAGPHEDPPPGPAPSPGAAGPGTGGPGTGGPGTGGPGTGGPGTGGPGTGGPGTGGSKTAGPGAAGLTGTVNLTIPLATLLGLAETPGDLAGFGPITAHTARQIAASTLDHTAVRWCLTITGPTGCAVGHGCATRTKPSPGPGPSPRSPAAGPSPGPPATRTRGRAAPGQPGWAFTFNLTALAGPGCAHTRQSTHYRPPPSLWHLIQIRNPRCTAPGCRMPAATCDDDHTIPFEKGGRTCECNLGPLCRHHHRIKQAHGWRLIQPQPGIYTWITPSSRQYTTGPGEHAA